MNAHERTDARIAQWLSDGPTEASDRLIDAILGDVRDSPSTSASARGPFGFGRSMLLGGVLVSAIIVTASAMSLAAWRPSASSQAGPGASAVGAAVGSQQPTSSTTTGQDGPWVPYVSRQPSFSVSHPATWRPTLDYLGDGRPSILAFEATDRDAVITISFGSRGTGATMPCGPIGGPPDPVRCIELQGSSVDELGSAYGRFIERCCSAKPDPSTEHLLVAGMPAVLLETWNEPLIEGSARDFTLAALFVHDDAPVAIVWTAVLGDHAADRRDLLRFLGTFQFGASGNPG